MGVTPGWVHCSNTCTFKQRYLILRFPNTHTAPIQTLLTYSDPLSFWLFCLKESGITLFTSFL